MKKERQSNIELLRIISILLIISFHYVFKSGYVFEELNISSFIVKSFYMFGELGVNIFILIMGYFMVNSKFSAKKLIKLVLEVYFYYIITVLIAIKIGFISSDMGVINRILLCFPITISKYWFVSVYILIYIFSPYFNILIHSMEKRNFQKLLITSLLVWSVIPTILGIFYNSTETLLYYSRFIWLVIIYFVGAYIRLYDIKIYKKRNSSMIGAILSFFIMLMGIIVIYLVQHNFNILNNLDVAYFWPPNTIPMFIFSISVFEIFLKIRITSNKIINMLASTTLGIYMIHDGMLNPYIWKNIFSTLEHLNSSYFVIYILGTTIIIFIVGAIIDLIRQFIEKYTVNKLLDSKFYSKLSNKVSNSLSRFLDII